jgi:diadenosine tetraphosphate (Ap4A) HIT family hydrolase
MYHYRKSRQIYDSQPKPVTCDFCNAEEMNPRIIFESEYCFVIANRVFYDVWELRNVTDHLLVIPKEHAMTLSDLSPKARLDIMNVFALYEAQHYNIYARSPASSTRSVVHQHTHLIKADNRIGRGAVMIKKPYVLIKF